jgi:PilZ domain
MLLLQEPIEADESASAERRRGLRIAQDRPIKVLDMSGGRYFGGRTHDVSATGLRIELPGAAAVHYGQMLSIHVGLTRTGESLANRRQMIPARVVWIDRSSPSSKTLTAGVEFTAMIGAGAQLDAA